MPRKSVDVPAGTTLYVRMVAIACGICGGTWCFGLAGMMWQHPGIFTIEPWYELALGVLFCAGSAYAYLLSDHRVSAIIIVPIGVYLIADMIYNPYLFAYRAFGAWEFFAILQTIFGVVILVGGGVLIVHIIAVSITRFVGTRANPETRGLDIARQHLRKFKPLHLGLLIAITGSGLISQALSNNWFTPTNATVTLHPGNYVARFQFYGPSGFSTNYTAPERADLNALGVRIITGVTDFVTYQQYLADPYTWWMNLTTFEQTVQYKNAFNAINNTFYPWKKLDPNITFLYWLHGIPSGLPDDYSVTGSSYGVGAMLLNAWLTAQAIVELNLTNVVGFHTDQESVDKGTKPIGGPLNQTFQDTRSYDRSEQATDNYLSFFKLLRSQETSNSTWRAFDAAMTKSYGIDHLLFTTTYGGPTVVAGLGGMQSLRAMDVFTEDVVNTVPYDQFLPMLYNQGEFPPDRAQHELYVQLQELQTTLAVDGFWNPTGRIGVLLGCMGNKASMFLPNYTGSMWTGSHDEQVTGFAVVARQVLIAKCFNCSWISFFPYQPYYPDIYGINDTFGESFFDHLNTTVNGVNDTIPFTIRLYVNAGSSDTDIARVVFMSDAWAWFYTAGLVVVFAMPIAHYLVNKRRKA